MKAAPSHPHKCCYSTYHKQGCIAALIILPSKHPNTCWSHTIVQATSATIQHHPNAKQHLSCRPTTYNTTPTQLLTTIPGVQATIPARRTVHWHLCDTQSRNKRNSACLQFHAPCQHGPSTSMAGLGRPTEHHTRCL